MRTAAIAAASSGMAVVIRTDQHSLSGTADAFISRSCRTCKVSSRGVNHEAVCEYHLCGHCGNGDGGINGSAA
jgi:hypothetical protein